MTAVDAPAQSGPLRFSGRQRLTLLVMCLVTFMIQVDVTIVNVALPSIQSDLGLAAGPLLWIVTAYALSLAAFIPVAGAVGDRLGHRPVFISGVAVFVAGSAACALSHAGLVLIIARAIQGVGAAAMLALTLSIIANTFPPEVRARVIGTWAAVGGTGFGVGPVAGGLILSVAGWPAVFWVNVPVGLLTVLGAWVALPRVGRSEHPFDTLGAFLCATGLFCFTFGLTQWSTRSWASPAVFGPLLLGVLLLLAFVAWQRKSAHPMAPPALIRVPGFAPAAVVYLLVYVAFSGILFFSTLLYQDVAGWSVLQTGLSWLFMNVPFLAVAQSGGALQRLLSVRTRVVGGCLAAAAGAGLLATADATTPFLLTAFGFVLSGIGFGAFMPPLAEVAMAQVPLQLSGVASGLFNTARQVGTSVGLVALGYVGATATRSQWQRWVTRISPSPSARVHALGSDQQVVTARVAEVGHDLGPVYRQAAAASFEHGYHWAVGMGAVLLVVAAIVAARTFPRSSAAHTGRRFDAK